LAIVAPSSAPHEPRRLAEGLAILEDAGFQLDWHPTTLTRRGYLAGTDTERAHMFNQAIRNPQAKALICTRGGYGAMRILDRIDYAAAKQSPKLLIGFSDITVLHLALYRHAGWRGISGPLVVSLAESCTRTKEQLLALFRGEILPPVTTLNTLRPGRAQGPLLGGNLTMVTRLLGTPYLPSLNGAILFLEEVNEAPYRIDALLAQLRLSGVLESIGGLILGAFTGWEPQHPYPALIPPEILEDYFGNAPYPVASGLNYGHFANRDAFPVGARATLAVDAQTATLTVQQPVSQHFRES